MILEIVLGLAILGWCLSSFLVWHTQDRAIFVGDGAAFGDYPELAALGGVALRAQRDGQALRWYWIEAENAKAVLILFHGNAGGAMDCPISSWANPWEPDLPPTPPTCAHREP